MASVVSKQTKTLKVPKGKEDTFQWEYPHSFNLPGQTRSKPKPEGRISYRVLRNFSVHYPIARSCIDYLKTKIIKLNWAIAKKDEADELDTNDSRVLLLNDFIESPLGERTHYRNLIDAILEDYFVMGSFSLERMRTRGGQFLNELKLVDTATIKLKVDEFGRMPSPPDTAFVQYIRGKKVTELNQDELIYIKRSNRTNTIYGLSPIESIIIQAESAIKGSIYNLKWFSDGNVPEGFGELPESWTQKQIKTFQKYFDSILAGNPRFQRRIKMVPKGFKYSPIKKPDDIGYEKFELWLLQLTCTVFGIPPQDIGFTHQINKSSGETQAEKGQERGMKPVVQMLEEFWSDIVQNDFGYKDLKFVYTDVDPVDKKLEAEIDSIRLADGVISADEIRAQEGKEPIGLNHYVKGGTVELVEDLTDPKIREEKRKTGRMIQDSFGNKDDKKNDDKEEKEKIDLTLWQKQSINAFKRGKKFKKFDSKYLNDWMIEEIYNQLKKVKNRNQIKYVFDPYISNKMQIVKQLSKLSNELTKQT